MLTDTLMLPLYHTKTALGLPFVFQIDRLRYLALFRHYEFGDLFLYDLIDHSPIDNQIKSF